MPIFIFWRRMMDLRVARRVDGVQDSRDPPDARATTRRPRGHAIAAAPSRDARATTTTASRRRGGAPTPSPRLQPDFLH